MTSPIAMLMAMSMGGQLVQADTDRPIISIFSQPASEKPGYDYIAASYVKWVEQFGARVVPIPYAASKEEIDSIFASTNGVLFPGGFSRLPFKCLNAKPLQLCPYFMNHQRSETQPQREVPGDHFPMWGTCMGFQWLLMMQGNFTNLDGPYDAENISLPLGFSADAKTSRSYAGMDPDFYKKMSQEPLTMNNHHYGLSSKSFNAMPILSNFFDILATNNDRGGKEFISQIEAKNYPVYGTQWHPEKNQFEYGVYPSGQPYEVINHSEDGIRASMEMAKILVGESRLNNHSFSDPAKEKASLIYNYITSQDSAPDFVESYYFDWKL